MNPVSTAIHAAPGVGPLVSAADLAGHLLGINPGSVDDALKADKKKTIKASALVKKKWSGANAQIAKAVLIAESGGNANAVHQNDDGSTDVGLMENNSVHAGEAGSPKELKAFIEWNKDIDNNLGLAYSTWKSQGWGGWSTYNNRAYLKYMNSDVDIKYTEKQSLVGDAVDSVTAPVKDGLSAVGDFFSILTSADTWFRIAKGIGGSMMILLGGIVLLYIAARKAGASTPVKAVTAATKII